MNDNKSIEERLDTIERDINEIKNILKWAEKEAKKPKMSWTDGPIMAYGKHNIQSDTINNKE